MKELRYNTRIKVGDVVDFAIFIKGTTIPTCSHIESAEKFFTGFNKDVLDTTITDGTILEIYLLKDYSKEIKYTGSKMNQNKHMFVLIQNDQGKMIVINHIGNLKK